MAIDVAIAAGILWGLVHGLEPGHGWPLAVAYVARRKGGLALSAVAGALIGLAHLVSSVAVLVVWLVASAYAQAVLDSPWVPIVAGLILLTMGVVEFYRCFSHWSEHEHGDLLTRGATVSLKGLVVAAFALGFAHEEEFALIALCATGVQCTLFILLYAAAVTLALVVAVALGNHLMSRLRHSEHILERWLPLAAGSILVALGIWQVLVGTLRLAA